MKTLVPWILSLAATTAALESAAYELNTHGALTLAAYERSLLARDPRVSADLGFDINAVDPFSGQYGPLYFDVTGSRLFPRDANAFEFSRMPKGFEEPRSIAGWLIGGAIREDDLTSLGCRTSDLAAYHWPGDCNPQDDPYQNVDRVVNHFYDPYFNKGLISTFASGPRTPDWATGATDAFQHPNQALLGRHNHFTLMDARHSMYYAL